jgi:hypothetical protein
MLKRLQVHGHIRLERVIYSVMPYILLGLLAIFLQRVSGPLGPCDVPLSILVLLCLPWVTLTLGIFNTIKALNKDRTYFISAAIHLTLFGIIAVAYIFLVKR